MQHTSSGKEKKLHDSAEPRIRRLCEETTKTQWSGCLVSVLSRIRMDTVENVIPAKINECYFSFATEDFPFGLPITQNHTLSFRIYLVGFGDGLEHGRSQCDGWVSVASWVVSLFGNVDCLDLTINGINGVSLAASEQALATRPVRRQFHVECLGEFSSRIGHQLQHGQ